MIGIAVAALGLLPVRAAAQSCPGLPHALVLSGGAARGFAQVGALAVLDSMGFAPDLIVGTSAGALTGALYATGFSARQIDSLAQSAGLAGVFSGGGSATPSALGNITPLLYWEDGRGGLNIFSSSVLDTRLNARLNAMLLEANLAAAGDFSALPIPFAAVATDLVLRERVLLQNGDLVRAVRASMSIPLLFQPQELDGRYLVDGALSDNVPVFPARLLGARSLTIVDVTRGNTDTVDVHSTAAIARHLLGQQMLDQRDSLGADDRLIRPDLTGFSNLDFRPERLREAARRGMQAALAVPRLPGCGTAQRPAFLAAPSYRIDSVRITAARQAEGRFLLAALGLTPGDTVDRARIVAAYRDMERSPEPREVWLNPRRTPGGIAFNVVAAPAPRRAGGVLLGYDHDYGGRIGFVMIDRTPAGGALQVSGALTVSRYQQRAALALRPAPVSWNPLLPVLHARAAHEALQRYLPDGAPLSSLDASEYQVQLALEKVVAGRWLVSLGPLIHGWDVDSMHGAGAGVALRVTTGSEQRRPFIDGQATWTRDWWLTSAAVEAEGRSGGPWSTRVVAGGAASEHTPLNQRPALGGANGFPGYAVFDLRGDRTAYAELSGAHTLLPPFEVRLAFAAGRSWSSHTDEWLGGARLTLELPTPVGALRAGYGRSTAGTGAVFVRLGAWF